MCVYLQTDENNKGASFLTFDTYIFLQQFETLFRQRMGCVK